MLKRWFLQPLYLLFSPLISLFVKMGITPNMVTIAGLLANVAAAAILINGAFKDLTESINPDLMWAGILIIIGGIFDILDGRLARINGLASTAGALFDSVVDRYAELIMFLGISWLFLSRMQYVHLLGVFVCISGSLMVSYTRARGEALGADNSSGLMQRPERIVAIGFGAIALGIIGSSQPEAPSWLKSFGCAQDCDWALFIYGVVIWIVGLLANFTAVFRLKTAYKQLH